MTTSCYAKYSKYIIEIKTKYINIDPVDMYIITNESTATYKLSGFSYTIIGIQSLTGESLDIDLSEIASLWTPYKNKDHNKVFMTFSRAFYHNFLSEKQWKFLGEFNGYVRDYASNGQKILEYEIDIKYGNVNIVGIYNEWHPNGKKSKEIYDAAEKDDSEQNFILVENQKRYYSHTKSMREWNSDGIQIKSSFIFLDKYKYKISESIKSWFDNGTYKINNCVEFYENGNPKYEITHDSTDRKNNNSSTTRKYWYLNGQLSKEEFEVQQKQTVKEWYENGNPKSEINYIGLNRDGVQKKWNKYGELISKKYYKNDIKDNFLYKAYRKLFK